MPGLKGNLAVRFLFTGGCPLQQAVPTITVLKVAATESRYSGPNGIYKHQHFNEHFQCNIPTLEETVE